MHYRFHANLYKLPARLASGAVLPLRGVDVAPLREPDGRPPTFDEFLAISFEEAIGSLIKLPRVDAEPDGFFVQSGEVRSQRWQLDGHLFDFGDRLHRLELHGDCPPEALDALLQCVGWNEGGVTLAFELVHDGVALEESHFRRWAAAPA